MYGAGSRVAVVRTTAGGTAAVGVTAYVGTATVCALRAVIARAYVVICGLRHMHTRITTYLVV